jgi:hypothetical protein
MKPDKLKEKLEDLRQKKLSLEIKAEELKEIGNSSLICQRAPKLETEYPCHSWVCYKREGVFAFLSGKLKYRWFWFQCQHCDATMVLKNLR